MSLLKRLFGDKPAAQPEAGASQFEDSDAGTAPSSRSVPRREVVHVVLRETMRQHGIPTDWIECRTLSLVQSTQSTGTYVTLIVKSGQDTLLTYVPAFQASFRQALQRFDPRAADWLRGIAWQFDGEGADPRASMPDPAVWQGRPAAAASAVAAAGQAEDDELESDLKALFAIRDAALGTPSKPADFGPTERSGP